MSIIHMDHHSKSRNQVWSDRAKPSKPGKSEAAVTFHRVQVPDRRVVDLKGQHKLHDSDFEDDVGIGLEQRSSVHLPRLGQVW